MRKEVKQINTRTKFIGFPKMSRDIIGDVIITEKLDGTNACVIIENGEIVGVQSRKRMINVDDDNYGFASYISQNEELILKLGDGYHYGEWCGLGIQKNPHNLDAKYFYLFDTRRWNTDNEPPEGIRRTRTLYTGTLNSNTVEDCMKQLELYAEENNYKAEGVVVRYILLRINEKHTFKNSKGKWAK
jgi:hypothetical protein